MTKVHTQSSSAARAAAAANAAANRLLLPLLRSPAGRILGRRLAVLEYAGRRTGLPRELVAFYVSDGTSVRIDVGMAQGKSWWRNFEEPRRLRLRLAGTTHDALAHVVRDEDHVRVIAELEPTEVAGTELARSARERSTGGSA